MDLLDQSIDSRFQVIKRIGRGSFGQVFEGKDLRTQNEVAIKLEPCSNANQFLLYEAKILTSLQGIRGVPKIRWSGVDHNYNVLVMDLLGVNLNRKFESCRKKISTKDMVQIGIQLTERLEGVHQRCYIHRDIKPENFTLGLGHHKDLLYVIDFGLSKKYCDPKTLQHVPYRENKSLTGTARYASINSHLGLEQSRRDDLEALMYVIVYLMQGSLPWQGAVGKTKPEKYNKIMEKKMSTSVDVLCKGLPTEILLILKYVKSLRFEEQPNYEHIRKGFLQIVKKQHILMNFIFDWKILAESVIPSTEVQPKDEIIQGRRGSVRTTAYLSSSVSSISINSPQTGSQDTHPGQLPIMSVQTRLVINDYKQVNLPSAPATCTMF